MMMSRTSLSIRLSLLPRDPYDRFSATWAIVAWAMFVGGGWRSSPASASP